MFDIRLTNAERKPEELVADPAPGLRFSPLIFELLRHRRRLYLRICTMAEAAQAIDAAAEPEPAAEQLGSPPTSASPSHPTPSGGRKVRIRIFLGAPTSHTFLVRA